MRIILIYCLILISLYSCEKKCELVPISNNVFNVEKIKNQTVILKYHNSIDSLTFNDKYDSYTEKSYSGPLKHVVCKHSKAYKYNFRNETIEICLDKNENGSLNLSLNGWFNKLFDDRNTTEKDLLSNKEYVFDREADCDSAKSQIKRIILNGHLIKSIITIDDKNWKPI